MRELIKSTLFISLFILMGQMSYSQVIFGLKTGANLSNTKFINYLVEPKSKLSFYAGLLANIAINDRLLIRPELLYSVKGWKIPAYYTRSAGRVDLHYINVPLLVGYKPIEKVTILLGPEVGWLAMAILTYPGRKDDTVGRYNRIDVGVDLGVAYNLSSKFGLELRYNYAFTGVYKDLSLAGKNGKPGNDGNNRVFQLGVFYWLKGN